MELYAVQRVVHNVKTTTGTQYVLHRYRYSSKENTIKLWNTCPRFSKMLTGAGSDDRPFALNVEEAVEPALKGYRQQCRLIAADPWKSQGGAHNHSS